MRQVSVSDRAATGATNSTDATKRLFSYMQPYRTRLIIIAVLVILYNILNVIGPYLIGVAIDQYIEVGDLAGLGQIALWMTAVYISMWIAGAIYGRMMAKVAQNTLQQIRADLFSHMQRLSLSYYDQRSAGDLMSRLTNDIDAVNQLLSQNLITFLSSLTSLIGLLIAMLLLNGWLTLATLLVLPIMFGTVALLSKRTGPAFRELQMQLGSLNGLMEENLSGQRVVIAYGQQGASLDEFTAVNNAARDAGITANVIAGLMMALMFVLGNMNVAVVAGLGAWMAVTGFAGITVGVITTFINYSRQFGRPLMQIAGLFNSILAALAGAERIFEVLDTQPALADKPNAQPLDAITGEVIFKGVDFSYLAGEPILKKLSFDAKPGEMIALVGPTGAGKTTIINVLTHFYDIDAGNIWIDGQEIRDVQVDSLRGQIGVVLQDTFLFADTVMENIRYGRLDATDAEVIEAAKLANADSFVSRLPDGYHTMLSERAGNLSQGQRQLLTIARTILENPRILILDEATSSVDTRTEVQIQQALLTLMAGRTSFVIAHRLSTIREADQILVLKDGELIEQGSHEQLLADGGFYNNMFLSQFKGQLL